MKRHLWDSLKMLFVMTIFLGLIYPLVMTAIAQIFFPNKSNGSMIKINGRLVGSKLIGQTFTSNRYFWSRPSAIDYNPLPSGASNYGPTSDSLKKLVEMRMKEFIRLNGLSTNTHVPPDMLYASGSGIDPDISPASAELQIDRIAAARHFDEKGKKVLERLVRSQIIGPQLGFLGEPRANVLMLNLALDSLYVNSR
jgi:K+-transporting ATPase ATPase C chain